ncbi:MAG: DUF1549 domain-containing protein [Gemmataceae bacterium]
MTRFAVVVLLSMLGGTMLRAAPPEAAMLARQIDREIARKLAAAKLNPGPVCDDAEFVRRVYLDIAGVIPPIAAVEKFLESKDPAKRARLIDSLLDSPEYARQQADIWKELLIPKTAAAARRDHLPLVNWLRDSFASGKPLNQITREVLAGSGMQDESPGTTFYVVHESVDQVTDRVSRVFLGLQLQCAQCHDHPFQDWKREEYWALAGFFSKVGTEFKRVPGKGDFYGATETSKKKLMRPPSMREVAPQFLRGARPKLAEGQPFLPVLADWLTSADNPYYSKALVNRTWFHFFGCGLVNPIDDMSAKNEATHPELLELLAKNFAIAGFDARYLMRAICLSDTYQRRSLAPGEADAAGKLYAARLVKVLTPFQLHDSWEQVFNGGKYKAWPEKFDDHKAELRFHGSRNGFANFFQVEEDAAPVEYTAGIPQVLKMMNSRDVQRIPNALKEFDAARSPAPRLLENLYLATLARRPRATELEKLTAFLAAQKDQAQAQQDILWALLNSTEFATNH